MLKSKDVVNEFSGALVEGRGSIFVGSGISIPSLVPGWYDLLAGLARTRLNLEISSDDDLPLIAQHIVNATGTRGPLVSHFRRMLDQIYKHNNYHSLLTRCTVKRVWTTNYDTLIEDAFSRNFTVSVRDSDESISRGTAASDVEVIKMHGCIQRSSADELIVTQEDYENFFENRPATANRLKHDLLERQIMFIGYSYTDSNIRNIVVEARRLGNRSTRQHYIVLKRPTVGTDVEVRAKQQRQDLWLADLSRLGIAACQIDEYSELDTILYGISLRSRGDTVFVTGSHLSNGAEHPAELGALLADQKNVILLDGQSSGVGRSAMTAYLQRLLINRQEVLERLRLFPNPYAANPSFSNDATLLGELQKWRAPLLRAAQIVVIYDGGMGTESEVQLARELGCRILPVPTGTAGLAYRLVQETDIFNALSAADPEYASKAIAGCVKASDVAASIDRILKQ